MDPGLFLFRFFGLQPGGLLSIRLGSRKIARFGLAGSAACCILSPTLQGMDRGPALALLMFWGLSAAADSPQFSSLNARFAPRAYVGSALTLVNCMGLSHHHLHH